MELQQNLLKQQDSTINFCLDCGNLIDLPQRENTIKCLSCGFKCSILDYPYQEIITKKVFNEKKKWLEDLDNMEQEEKQQGINQKRTIIQENCPNPKGCDSTKLYYYTKQLRGADEGATVFYECVKCEYKWAQNN